MFEAVRYFQKGNRTQKSIGVHEEDSCLIAADDRKASVVRDCLDDN